MKYYKNFLKRLEELKPYIIEFEENGTIKPKIYLFDYVVGGNKRQLIIVIIHNKYIFSVNNRIPRA